MQIVFAIILATAAYLLFSSKKRFDNEALERAANVGGIIAAVAAIIVLELISKIVSDKNYNASQMNESEVILKETIITNQNATIILQPSK